MKITGGCHCGAVSYVVATDNLPPSYACHCLNCQTTSGSAFGLHALLPEDALQITGELSDYRYEGTHQASHHRLCAHCHTRIYNTTSAAPGMLVLRAGTLHNSAEIEPIAHIWVKRKQPWLQLDEGCPSWPESPTPEAFAQAMQARQCSS
ncbi:GFA family protein [Pseudomonas tumuqii]|uniref:GFA family protein n=1 Tax=Pseudomonas tumuqii TaxID=2715755 RepID=UPI0015540E75|nr:GFA family protein [Pseudomonas tumuqii]